MIAPLLEQSMYPESVDLLTKSELRRENQDSVLPSPSQTLSSESDIALIGMHLQGRLGAALAPPVLKGRAQETMTMPYLFVYTYSTNHFPARRRVPKSGRAPLISTAYLDSGQS